MPDEYISRKAAIAYIREQSEECQKAFEELGGESGIYADAYNDLAEDFYSIPAADVAEVVHGQWCVSKIRSIETVFYCSECKRTVTVGNDFFGEAPQSVSAAYPYCHCGAKMDGGNDDATD